MTEIREGVMYRHRNSVTISFDPDPVKRRRANDKVSRAMRAGTLIRQPCVICGETKVWAHHEQYDEPLEVVWLCNAHHIARHMGESYQAMRDDLAKRRNAA